MSDTPGKIEDGAKSVGEIALALLEKAPIYEDAVQPTAREIGQGLGGMMKMVLLPLKMMGYKADQMLKRFQDSLEEKTKDIPDENIIAPNPTIAGPIVQSLSYTLHEEPLREMFTSLLATAMDSRIASRAHPAFVEVIKQLSPDEALILKYVGASNSNWPVVTVNVGVLDSSGNNVGNYLLRRNVGGLATRAGCRFIDMEEVYLDNLERLKLITIDFNNMISGLEGRKPYEPFENLLNEPYHVPSLPAGHRYGEKYLIKGIVTTTRFGVQFYEACVKESGESETASGDAR